MSVTYYLGMTLNDSHTADSLAPKGSTIEARGHTTPDGVLHLSIPVGLADADVAVILQVKPLPAVDDVGENGWPRGYFDQVAGSMPELERAPQGEFERRLPLE